MRSWLDTSHVSEIAGLAAIAASLPALVAKTPNTSRPYRRLVCAQGWRGGCARNQ